MKIVLDQDIYKWLLGLDVLKMTALSSKISDGKAELDPSVTYYFSTGLIFARLITKIVKNLTKSSTLGQINISPLESFKSVSTPASLTYNWNVIADILKQLNVDVDVDVKNLIINGDMEMIHEVLKEIHKVYHPRNSPTRRQRGGSIVISLFFTQNLSIRQVQFLIVSWSFHLSKPKRRKSLTSLNLEILVLIFRYFHKVHCNVEADAIDVEKVKATQELGSTTSVLEFFMVSLSKHLALIPKQVIIFLFIFLSNLYFRRYLYLQITSHI